MSTNATPLIVIASITILLSGCSSGTTASTSSGGVSTDNSSSLTSSSVSHVTSSSMSSVSSSMSGNSVSTSSTSSSSSSASISSLSTSSSSTSSNKTSSSSSSANSSVASSSSSSSASTACNSLPASNTWDAASVSPICSNPADANFAQQSVSVVVDPYDTTGSTVWLAVGGCGLYKSNQCGDPGSWQLVSTGTNSDAINNSLPWSLIVDPVNPGVIYTVTAYNTTGAWGLWKSTNDGKDWTQLQPGGSALSIYFTNNVSMDPDPNNSLHLTAATHGGAPGYPNGAIAETFDGGNTWPNVVSMPASWGERGGVVTVNATTWIWGTGQGNGEPALFVTTDNGKTWPSNLEITSPNGGGSQEFTSQPLQFVNGAYYSPSLQGVLRSTDGINWSLIWQPDASGNIPAIQGLVVTDTTIYGSWDTHYYSAPLSDYTHWSPMPAPPALPLVSTTGACFLAYDSMHHVLYSSTFGGGLFRMRTQ